MIYKTKYNSPLGVLSMASDGKSLTGLWFEGQKYFEATLHTKPQIDDNLEVFKSAKNWLNRYFNGEKPKFRSFHWLLRVVNSDRRYGKFCAQSLMEVQ